MSKPTSAVKRRYNKAAYTRYEISLGKDSILSYKLDEHKANGGNVTELIKTALMEHFGLNPDDLAFPYVPHEESQEEPAEESPEEPPEEPKEEAAAAANHNPSAIKKYKPKSMSEINKLINR